MNTNRQIVLSILEGHCTFFSPTYQDLSPVQRLLVDFLSKVSDFKEVQGEHGGNYHSFDGFSMGDAIHVNKGLVLRGLLSISKLGKYKYHDLYRDVVLSEMIERYCRSNRAKDKTAIQHFSSVLQMIAGVLIENKLRDPPMSLREASQPRPEESTLDDIPF